MADHESIPVSSSRKDPESIAIITCIICHDKFKVYGKRRLTAKFCSRQCHGKHMALHWIPHNKSDIVRKSCNLCGNLFQIKPYRENIAKYCCRACYYESMKSRSAIVACVICGKEHRRPISHMKYRPTCSMECRGLANRNEFPVFKDYSTSTRLWMKRRNLIKSCNRCGYDDHPEILVVHHMDRDRTNNNPVNLEVLCPNCHALEHMSENKTGWNHASTRRQRPKNNSSQHTGNV